MAYGKSNKLHIVTAVAVIQREDGKILLLRRSDAETVYPGHYTFPGGKVEDNDTITEALGREVKEECGLNLSGGIILIKEKAIGRPDGQTSKSLSFLCQVDDVSEVTIDTNDFTEYRWVNLDELKDLKHVGIVAEFEKADAIRSAQVAFEPFYVDTDKVDFREG